MSDEKHDAEPRREAAEPKPSAAASVDGSLTADDVLEAIRPVKDPEIGLSIVDLGLIYGHKYDADARHLLVHMTLTSQMCPAGPEIIAGVTMMCERLPQVDSAEVELVWTPPWDPKVHCSEDAKAILGIWD